MGIGFSVRVAPGVRIRASRRGIRTSIGPRAARLHVGGGRPAVSTGLGPLTLSTRLGGGRRRSAGRPSMAAYQRRQAAASAAAAKAGEARRLAAMFQALLDVHRETFLPAQRPVAPPPPLPDRAAVRARHRAAALAGVGRLRFRERAAARAHADRTAEEELRLSAAECERQRAAYQAELDAWWAALLRNDPGVVLGALVEAFEDNEAAAAPVDVDGDEVSVVVLAPPEDVVPERMPARTARGALSLRRLPRGERAALYTSAVLGHVVVTVKETLAVAPAIGRVRIVALRAGGTDAYDRPRWDCVLAGRWSRPALEEVAWATADAVTVARDTAAELLVRLRGGRELQPLDLAAEPEIAALVRAVDVEDLPG